jgi:hypothetical protein
LFSILPRFSVSVLENVLARTPIQLLMNTCSGAPLPSRARRRKSPIYTLLTVIRKRPEITTERFREFMEHEYGPTYAGLSQTRSYIQYYLDDLASDGAEDPIDAIVKISFDSPEEMREALTSDSYQRAHRLRERYMRETSSGIHSAVVATTVTLV